MRTHRSRKAEAALKVVTVATGIAVVTVVQCLRTLGADRVRSTVRGANMGGEDFSLYLQDVPGCYVRLGARLPDCAGYPAHSSRFQIDEKVLATGAAWLAEVAVRGGQALAGDGPVSATGGVGRIDDHR